MRYILLLILLTACTYDLSGGCNITRNATNCSSGIGSKNQELFCQPLDKLKYDDITNIHWTNPASDSTCTQSRYILNKNATQYYTEFGCSDDVQQAWTITAKGTTTKYILSKEQGCLVFSQPSVPTSNAFYAHEFTGATKVILGNIGYKLASPGIFDYVSKEYCVPLDQVQALPSVTYHMQKTNFETEFDEGIFKHC